MRRAFFVASFAAALFFPFLAQARDAVYHLDFQPVVDALIAEKKIDGSVKFYLKGQKINGQVTQTFQEVSVAGADVMAAGTDSSVFSSERFVDSRKTAEDVDFARCTWALRRGVIKLHEAAKRKDANAVVELVSVGSQELSDPSKYECHAGTQFARVKLRGVPAVVR